MQPAPRSRYSSVAIAMHWTIGLMMIGTALGGLLHESFGKEAEEPIIGLHMASGLTILVLSIARLAWRLGHRPPPLATTLKRWEVGLAHATHWTFYLLMMVMPLSGWAMVSTSKQDWNLSVFGLFDAPFLPFKGDKPLGGVMHETHEILGYLVLGMIALHIAAAIKHHYFDGDNTVERMLPLLKSRR